MRSAGGLVAVLLAALLVPDAAAREARPRCFGEEATIVGTSGDDFLRGDASRDVIAGLGGNDTIVTGKAPSIEMRKPWLADQVCGGGGQDTIAGVGRLHGGPDDDIIRGGTRLYGGRGDDVLTGTDFVDRYSPGAGNDRVTGVDNFFDYENRSSAPLDVLDLSIAPNGVTVNLERGELTGWGYDRIQRIYSVQGSPFADVIVGSRSASDELWGGGGPDRIYGLAGRDCLFGEAGNDILRGGWQPDVFSGEPGDDDIEGGKGEDILDFSEGGPVTVDLTTHATTGRGRDRVAELEEIWGSEHDDVLIGSPRTDHLNAGEGADIVLGRGGDDYLQAGDRDSDDYQGGLGTDLLYYYWSFHGARVDLGARRAGTDTVQGIEGAIGSNGNKNVFVGDEDDNVFAGGWKRDVIDGNGGDDRLFGDSGKDTIAGGHGADIVVGDCTTLRELFNSDCGTSPDRLRGGAGRDLIVGDCHGFRYRCEGRPKDEIRGGAGVDRVRP